MMTRKKTRKPVSMTPTDPRTRSPELQAKMERLVGSLGYLILMKVKPEAAREMARAL